MPLPTFRVLAAPMAFVLFPPSLSLLLSFVIVTKNKKVLEPKYSEYPISSHLVVGPSPGVTGLPSTDIQGLGRPLCCVFLPSPPAPPPPCPSHPFLPVLLHLPPSLLPALSPPVPLPPPSSSPPPFLCFPFPFLLLSLPEQPCICAPFSPHASRGSLSFPAGPLSFTIYSHSL